MTGSEPSTPSFEPKIVGFLCNWCSYAGADKVGTAQLNYPSNFMAIKVMCSGRVDPQFVMKAFQEGADAVAILGCHPGDCHYKEGNLRCLDRYKLLLKVLEQLGIGKERFIFEYISASEADKFVSVVQGFVDSVRKLGPLKAG